MKVRTLDFSSWNISNIPIDVDLSLLPNLIAIKFNSILPYTEEHLIQLITLKKKGIQISGLSTRLAQALAKY